MAKKKKIKNDVLIALIKEPRDFYLLETELWYRIPVKNAPKNVKNGEVKIIAFYIGKKITKELPIIRYYGPIISITQVKRKALLPNETPPLKSPDLLYYKIQIEKLIGLERPILNLCPRRILFVPTTQFKFNFVIKQKQPDFNLLFNDSPLEDKLYEAFLSHNIRSHRQYFLTTKTGNYHLDFALFCKEGKINVECDGDTYHDKKEQVHYDKKRNNNIEVEGWSVLRYTTKEIVDGLEDVVHQVQEKAEKYGGYEKLDDIGEFQYKPKINPGEQGRLFD
jgi:very-short-patch-repair endonuclease